MMSDASGSGDVGCVPREALRRAEDLLVQHADIVAKLDLVQTRTHKRLVDRVARKET